MKWKSPASMSYSYFNSCLATEPIQACLYHPVRRQGFTHHGIRGSGYHNTRFYPSMPSSRGAQQTTKERMSEVSYGNPILYIHIYFNHSPSHMASYYLQNHWHTQMGKHTSAKQNQKSHNWKLLTLEFCFLEE